jgi:hypothetical protein
MGEFLEACQERGGVPPTSGHPRLQIMVGSSKCSPGHKYNFMTGDS